MEASLILQVSHALRNGKHYKDMRVIMHSQVMNSAMLSFFILTLISGCHGNQKDDADAYLSRFVADLWLEGADIIKIIWRDCSKKLVDVKDVIDHNEYFPKFVRCMKRKTLRALDRSLNPDVVPVADGINLVRTAKFIRMRVEYRGRRRHHMMTMMMFGIVSIGMVLIPMGFQFLAVLGGKALLLAKMALILASIQGLKKVDPSHDGYHDRGKIASSPVNYGFYHSPPYDYYEKRSRDDWPPPAVMPVTSPPTLSVQSWPNNEAIKIDRSDVANDRVRGNIDAVTWRPELPKAIKQEAEARVYPVYAGPEVTPFTSIDAPTPLADLTTRPGEVQADYALELPFNGLRFQSPTTVVST
ncbi:unnamed protein product [Diatraea saccharalis]|uniref:Uncharacterized protein n=1 Tax=Diatraea saccharalis TaxID=40085 RepID=A0A9N9RET3_9NEOP|nr:unnamed protein product [Diatraea saccharalis]